MAQPLCLNLGPLGRGTPAPELLVCPLKEPLHTALHLRVCFRGLHLVPSVIPGSKLRNGISELGHLSAGREAGNEEPPHWGSLVEL